MGNHRKDRVICKVEGCGTGIIAKGLCSKHWQEARRRTQGIKVRGRDKCSINGCDKLSKSRNMCAVHYTHWRKYGDALKVVDRGSKLLNPYKSVYCEGKQVKEHRLKMENLIGRKLFKHENVHHINGMKRDNRIENLELWSSFQPCGQRVIDKVKWAREVIKLYGDIDGKA